MAFCGKNKRHAPDWVDPLGPTMSGRTAPSGAPEMRSEIYQNLRASALPQARQATQEAAGAIRSAASDPAWGVSSRALTGTASGGFLRPNPHLTNAIEASRRAADTRIAGAGEEARAGLRGQQEASRSGFTRNGVSFGTGQTLAQEGAKTALEASLARGSQSAAADMNAAEAGLLEQNYARERALQMDAAKAAPMVASGRAGLLSALPGMYLAPDTEAAKILAATSTGQGQAPTISREPGVIDYATQVMSSAGGNW